MTTENLTTWIEKSPLCPPRIPCGLVWYRIISSDDARVINTIKIFTQ